MPKRRVWITVVAVVMVGAAAFLMLRRSDGQTTTYQTVKAAAGDVRETVAGTGDIQSKAAYSVVIQTQGIVDRLLVDVGDTVRLGRKLLSVSGKPLYAIKGSSPIYRVLTSGDEGDDVKWLQQSLEAMGYDVTVDSEYGGGTIDAVYAFQDDKGLENTSDVGPDTFQTFPLPLTVMDVAVSQGESVTQGAVAMTLANPRALKVVVDVNEIDIPKIKRGQRVEITVDALPGKTFPGKVSNISPGLVAAASGTGGADSSSSSQSSQTGVVSYPVTVELTHVDRQLKAGMKANADIIIAEKKNVLSVPQGAIRERHGRKTVLVPNADGGVRPIWIQVGLTSDATAQIVSGLEPGQEVVIGFGGSADGASSANGVGGQGGGAQGQNNQGTGNRRTGGMGPGGGMFGGPPHD